VVPFSKWVFAVIAILRHAFPKQAMEMTEYGKHGKPRSRLSTLPTFTLIVVGLVMGVPMALAAGWLLSSQLHGVSQRDPIVLSIAVATLAACAFFATILPAYRASSVSPLKALRVD
jgi:hypothetical protein